MTSAQEVETSLAALEKALVKLQAALGSTVKLQKAEVDILGCIQKSRDLMMGCVQNKNDKDRSNLIDCFGGDCRRIAKFRGVFEAITLSDKYKDDARLHEGLNACKLIEDILREKGHSKALDEAQGQFIPWKPPGSKEGAPAEGPVAAPAPKPAPTPAPAPAPKPKPAPAPPAAKQAEEAPAPTLRAPESTTKVIVTSQGEQFAEDEETKRNITVEMTVQVAPEVAPGSDGSIAVEVPTVKMKLETSVSPPWPKKAKPFKPVQEFVVPVPDFEKVLFDPKKKVPRFQTMVTQQADILEIPGDLEVSVASKSLSPWGSVCLHDGKEETNVHHTASIAGAFGVADGEDSRTLSITLNCTVVLMLSGAGSAKFTEDGAPLEMPNHAA